MPPIRWDCGPSQAECAKCESSDDAEIDAGVRARLRRSLQRVQRQLKLSPVRARPAATQSRPDILRYCSRPRQAPDR